MTVPLWITFLVFITGTIIGFFTAATLCAGKDNN